MLKLFNCNTVLILIISVHFCYLENIDNFEDEEENFVPRVVNGYPAKLGDVPYQLAFKSLLSRSQRLYTTFCGGSIIGPSKVLTAAHCFEDRTSRCLRLLRKGRVGSKKLRSTFAVAGNLMNYARYSMWGHNNIGQWRRLHSMYIPTNYKFPRNDICVGFTTEPFIFNSNVASKPYANEFRQYKGKCLVSGYGRVSNKKESSRLLLADLEVLSKQWCSRLHRKNMDRFICTSDKISDVNKGDSGGPLVCDGQIVGVVSGNRPRVGSFFTRVSTHHKFIETARACSVRGGVLLTCLSIIIYGEILLF